MGLKVINVELPKEFESVELYILSDLHIGDKLANEKEINRLIDEINSQENRFVIVNGDILNMAIKDSISDIYEEKYNPNEAIDEAVAILSKIKDRILIITEGNHELRVGKKDGILIMYQVAKRLFNEDAQNKYSKGAYLIFLSFGKNQRRDCRKTVYSIYGKHGTGGGRTIGGKANRLEEMMAIVDADIYIHSHTHIPLTFRHNFIRTDYRNRKITIVEKLFVNSNAFLNYGGYGEDYGYKVASIKCPKIILQGNERRAECII